MKVIFEILLMLCVGHASVCVGPFMSVGMCMCTCVSVCVCTRVHSCIQKQEWCLSGVCSGLPFSLIRLSFVFFITLCTMDKLVHKLPGKCTVPASYLTMGALGFHMCVTPSEFSHWFQSFNFSYQTCISSIFAYQTSPPASIIHIFIFQILFYLILIQLFHLCCDYF